MASSSPIVSGFLNINKPAGMTSHDVVNRVRRIVKLKQVGHAGTLDPMATGVMVVAMGKATRLLRFLADDKSYLATIKLGLITDTDDVEGKTIATDESAVTAPPSLEKLQAALEKFRGPIAQIPPFYSAIHVDGKRLYELARSGQAPPEIEPRHVTILSLELVSYEAPLVVIRVHCSKGTYIRSIARDLGHDLGIGGTLAGLVRETSGRFSLSNASSLDELMADPALAAERFIAVQDAVALPILEVATAEAKRLCMGQKLAAENLSEEQLAADYLLTINSDDKKPFCISRTGTADDGEKYLAPEVVFENV